MGLGAILVVRWALYADLGLLFGAPLAVLLLATRPVGALSGWILGTLSVLGLGLSGLGFALTVAAMAGSSVDRIDPELLSLVLTGTPFGWAFLVRMGALLLVLAALFIPWSVQSFRLNLTTMLAAIAVASLAWSGHAAASQGVNGLVRLTSDIAHLLAASAWLGALVILLRQVFLTNAHDVEHRRQSAKMLSRFSLAGSVIVAALIITGSLNAAFIFSPSDLLLLPSTTYGQLLLIKLIAFAVMLGLAGLNRFYLTPALSNSAMSGDAATAIFAVRTSIGLELVLVTSILALVAWLGTLDPNVQNTCIQSFCSKDKT